MKKHWLWLAFLLMACGSGGGDKKGDSSKASPLKYEPLTAELPAYPEEKFTNHVMVTGATLFDGAGKVLENAYLHVKDGKILAVGSGQAPAAEGAQVIDASGRFVTPGIIDTHSHMGVYPQPWADAHSDGNEATANTRADVWAEHSFWPQDPAIPRVISSGVTTIQVLPGSANLIGGRSFTAKLRVKNSAREMRFRGAPQGVKMACGENPKRVYGKKGGPSTRMGNIAGFRKTLLGAVGYRKKYQGYQRDLDHWKKRVEKAKKDEAKLKEIGDPPSFDLDIGNETLRKVLEGEILVHVHCYRADDISAILDLSKEFGFKVRSIHHGLEAYKIAKRLAQEKVSVSTWVDWWGFKLEAFDGIPQNVPLLHQAGARAILHSDSEIELRHMNHEMAKALQAAHRVGIKISQAEAMKWITLNPAWALGIDEVTGSLEKGKMADFVIWDGSPFSVYSKPDQVFMDGEVAFDRNQDQAQLSDFQLGHSVYEVADGRDFGKGKGPLLPSSQEPKPIPSASAELNPKDAVIRNVVIWNGSKPSAPTDVRIRNGKVARIGKVKAAKNTVEIDGTDRVLTAPLHDINSVVGLTEVEIEKSATDRKNRASHLSGDFRVLDSFNPLSSRVVVERADGVGSFILQPGTNFIAGLGGVVSLDGSLQGRPTAASSKNMFMTISSWVAEKEGESKSGLWLRMRQLVRAAGDYLKNPKSFKSNSVYKLPFDLATIENFANVLRGRTILMVEVNRAADIKTLLDYYKRWKKSYKGLKINILGGMESWLLSTELARLKIPVWVHPSQIAPSSFDSLQSRDDLAAYLVSKKVPVRIQSGYQQRLRQEAGIAVSFGLDPASALRAITLSTDKIKVGAPAHFVLWSGDPFQVSQYPERMWLKGKEVSLFNRQLELAHRYK